MGRVILDISLRALPEGGDVLPEVYTSVPAGVFTPHSDIATLVIHGYEVPQCDACNSYEEYLERLPQIFPNVVRVFWPGDATWWGGSKKFYYPRAVGNAREAAPILAEHLGRQYRERGWPRELVIVAHSLGNRLALELVSAIAAKPGNLWPRVSLVCLMAAAVPVPMVDEGGSLRAAVERVEKLLVLYSPNDSVLQWTFKWGQRGAFLSGHENDDIDYDEAVDTAVGRFGEPRELTSHRYNVCGAGHGDYWSSYESVMYVGTLLGVVVPRRLAEGRLRKQDLETVPTIARYHTPTHTLRNVGESMCAGCVRK